MKATKSMPAQLLAESGPQPTMEQLGEISKAVKEAWLLEERIEKGTALLAKLGEQLNIIKQKVIPDLMAKFNLTELTTADSIKVKVVPYYSGKIISPSAYDWLDENGHGGAVKTEVFLPLGKDMKEKGQEAVDILTKYGFMGACINTEVHHATLKALVKEIMESGKTLPDDKFTVHSGRVAKITVK